MFSSSLMSGITYKSIEPPENLVMPLEAMMYGQFCEKSQFGRIFGTCFRDLEPSGSRRGSRSFGSVFRDFETSMSIVNEPRTDTLITYDCSALNAANP